MVRLSARLLVHRPVSGYSLSHVAQVVTEHIVRRPAADRVRSWLQGRDLAVFQSVAGRHWPGADPCCPS
ncbi:hypothetical protein Smic_70200 [Streptomyces microflavus]|uniref:Uncharacterized protein n=1 Tax=Streptomyces microflavus TaxID=1919 RepID=A0A7J0D2P7_STRMI|nr:hypothetical protein Smic_70200 [Streptomyces microflavus]